MKRERIAWGVSLLILTLTAFRISASQAHRDDDYRFVRTFVDIQRQVASNYVDDVDEGKLQQAAIDGMLEQLDPFTMYVPPAKRDDFDRMLEGTFKGVGVQLKEKDNGQIEVVTPIDGSPAFQAGVQAGDIILKVNGESIEGLSLSDVIKRIGGDLGTEVRLTVRHEDATETELSMKRQEILVPTVKGYLRKTDNSWDYYICDDPKIAYIRLSQFTPTSFDTIKSTVTDLRTDGMQGLILDLRYNPGGQLDQAVKIVDLFIEKGVIVSTRGRNRPQEIKSAKEEGTLPNFPLVVLVNEHSASASEIVAGSLMDNHRAVVVGTRTYGKGSVQELIPLDSNNGELKLTVAHYYLPSGRLVHKKKDAKDWGVDPQIIVPMDDATQKDVARERAEADQMLRPSTKPSTRPSGPTGMKDVQLQRAVDTLIAAVIFGGQGPVASLPAPTPAAAAATTRATTEP